MEQGWRSRWAQTHRRTPYPPRPAGWRQQKEDPSPDFLPSPPAWKDDLGTLDHSSLFLIRNFLMKPHTPFQMWFKYIPGLVFFFLSTDAVLSNHHFQPAFNCFNGFWKNSHLLSLLIKAPGEPKREGCWGTGMAMQLIWELYCHTLASEPSTCPTFLREVGTYNSIRSPGFITSVKRKKMQMPKPKQAQLHF